MVYRFGCHWLISSCCEAPFVLADLFNRHAVAVRTFVAVGPFGEYVGDVVGFDRCAFIVEAEAVGGRIVEPDEALTLSLSQRARVFEFFKDERGGADAGVRFKNSAG